MISDREIKEQARSKGVPITTIERDYVQNWLLSYIGTINMILKGGTGIRKMYIEDYRFSDDLDFTLLKAYKLSDVKRQIEQAVLSIKEEVGINFDDKISLNNIENGYEGIVYFRILSRSGSPLRIKLDMTSYDREKILTKIMRRKIIHPYSDECAARMPTYSLKEIIAEKIRALFERTRPRDLHDINYFKRFTNEVTTIKLLKAKCKFKGVVIDVKSLLDRKADFEKAWLTSLQHQMRQVPEFEKTFNTVIENIRKIQEKF